jgi:hypothetical protein
VNGISLLLLWALVLGVTGYALKNSPEGPKA